MLVIRLTRVGKKKQPTFRIVVQDKRKDPWGKALDIVGHYNPRSTPKAIKLEVERIKTWLAKGAKPSPSVHNLLIDAKVMTGEKLAATGGTGKKGKTAEAPAEEKKAEEPKA